MTDDELIEYARHHCRTELALFHAEHLRRLCALAGVGVEGTLADSDAFFAFDREHMDPLLALIAVARS